MPTNTNAGHDRVITEADRLSDVVTKACADNLVEAQEATSLMNFTVRCLEQRLKDAVCEVDEYRRAIVDLEAKIKRLEEDSQRLNWLLKRGLAWRDCYNDWWKEGEWLYASQSALETIDEAKEAKP
jgi:hypothetical protein